MLHVDASIGITSVELLPIHAFIKDMQLHPLRDTLQHFDLLEVRMDRAIQATVSIVFWFTGLIPDLATFRDRWAAKGDKLRAIIRRSR